MPSLKSVITNYFVPLLPKRWRLPFIYRRYCAASVAEQEIIHLEKISSRFRVAVDIGANQGLYSYKMSQHFREVYAFEINSDLTVNLRHVAAANIRIFDQGLSAQGGEATLYTPVLENGFAVTGWASLSLEDVTREFVHLNGKVRFAEKAVQIRSLDSFKLQDVDFIKIDVEGHEAEVLKGAIETLRSNRPRLLVEAKARLGEVDDILTGLQYTRIRFEDVTGYPALEDLHLYAPSEEIPEGGKSAR